MPSIPSVSRASGDRYKSSVGTSRRGYFIQRNGFQIWRTRLSIGLPLAVVAGLLAWFYWPGKVLTDPRSHGTVTHAHSSINNNCAQCHQSLDNGLFDIHERWTTLKCTECHLGTNFVADGGRIEETKVYAPHALKLSAKDFKSQENCAACHHDHKGENFALSKVPDSTCMNCHKNLGDLALPSVHPRNSFADFAHHPPKYASLDDPKEKGEERAIKFSHAYHMTEGIVFSDEQLKNNRGVRVGADGQNRQLQCASCHALDTAGAYYLPVKFENHCATCHNEGLKQSLVFGGETLDPIVVQHGLYFNGKEEKNAPKKITLSEQLPAQILERLIAAKTKGHPELESLLGQRLDPRFHAEIVKPLEPEWKRLSENMLKDLRRCNCKECHDIEKEEVKKPSTPPIWLSAAKFSHFAHKDQKCADCHPNQQASFLDPPPEGWEKGDIGIPNFDSCLKCHTPKSRDLATSGSRHDCTTCHQYHHQSPTGEGK